MARSRLEGQVFDKIRVAIAQRFFPIRVTIVDVPVTIDPPSVHRTDGNA